MPQNNTMRVLYFTVMSICLVSSNTHAQIDEAKAEELVKNAHCLNDQSIENVLKDKFKTHSQRDLGWQVFKEQDQFDVERAFLMSKSMQLRFRWHVTSEGLILPDGSRAKSLCIDQ